VDHIKEYNELVKFWRDYAKGPAKGIHPKDNIPLEKVSPIGNLREYCRPENFRCDMAKNTIYSGLLPGPFCGDIKNARVYILQLNPGFSLVDFFAESIAVFKQTALEVLRQNTGIMAYPFFLLDPHFCWTGGSEWYYKKFKPLFELFTRQGASYFDAGKIMGKKIATLELFPYHSFGFSGNSKLLHIESVRLIKAFVQAISKDGDKLFIVTRMSKMWGLSKAPNIKIIPPNQARAASLQPYKTEIFDFLKK